MCGNTVKKRGSWDGRGVELGTTKTEMVMEFRAQTGFGVWASEVIGWSKCK